MQTQLKLSKDRLGAALLILLGIAVVVAGRGYRMGTLTHMGAGYIPVALGVLLIAAGTLIGITAGPRPDKGKHSSVSYEWRGWSCILGGVCAFVVLGTYGGMVPATFAAVFIPALGDRENSLRDAFLLACGMVLTGVLIFSWALKLPLPLFTWG